MDYITLEEKPDKWLLDLPDHLSLDRFIHQHQQRQQELARNRQLSSSHHPQSSKDELYGWCTQCTAPPPRISHCSCSTGARFCCYIDHCKCPSFCCGICRELKCSCYGSIRSRPRWEISRAPLNAPCSVLTIFIFVLLLLLFDHQFNQHHICVRSRNLANATFS